ncbi:porin family protein [Sodaliphilus sp.]|uniref:porin family protein n=1 Tax=Sodaliphilus sp. TaxID=2815818 RepID=UPI00388E7559
MKKIILAIAVALTSLSVGAMDLITNADINVRLGYGIGGTMPLGMPATIRHLNSYKMQFNPSLGIDVAYPVYRNWSIMAGLQLENKGMDEDAQVKNYKMEITRGGQTLAGVFTGDVTTKVTEWMLTLPVQAVFHYKKVNFKFGPYVSYVGNRDFSGWAHNGHLRVDDPTGPKVLLGEGKDERGEYDFTSSMRRMQVGVDLGVDYHFDNRFGAFFDLAWGMSQLHKTDFHTIEQTLYPIYGKVGLTYRLK